MSTYKLIFENNSFIEGADFHLLMTKSGWTTIYNLNINDEVILGNNFVKIIDKQYNEELQELYDLSTNNGDYLTCGSTEDILTIEEFIDNAVLSHNTITAAITLLHYCTFNTSKGCMIIANKSDTVIEIIDKIKNIYKLLPFFLKAGIINWNTKNIVFDNGCRIKSQARSKEPAIGFTIDFLYIDEFAHIPKNIINHYYKAAIPTVSSIKGSKIVITSTPNGSNLFKDLVTGASYPEGHIDKNMYKLIKVYWYQVPDGTFDDGTRGTRLDPKLYALPFEMKSNNITINMVIEHLNQLGFKTVIEEESSDTGIKQFIRVLYNENECNVDIIKNIKINNINLSKIFNITNWKEQETKLIEGEEAFNQEYGLQFIAGAKRVLSANKAKELDNRSTKYKSHNIEILAKKLHIPYDELRWAPDYIEQERNNYYWVSMLDISEGLDKMIQ